MSPVQEVPPMCTDLSLPDLPGDGKKRSLQGAVRREHLTHKGVEVLKVSPLWTAGELGELIGKGGRRGGKALWPKVS